ncbi:hypothetical protein GGS20DRAFT_157759 [Poronia punctata]|nr:hypothetical protein GGS20DRAFT_157759 [Poronia punctata]
MANQFQMTDLPLEEHAPFNADVYQGIDFSGNFDQEFERDFARHFQAPDANEPGQSMPATFLPEGYTHEQDKLTVNPEQTYTAPIPQSNYPDIWTLPETQPLNLQPESAYPYQHNPGYIYGYPPDHPFASPHVPFVNPLGSVPVPSVPALPVDPAKRVPSAHARIDRQTSEMQRYLQMQAAAKKSPVREPQVSPSRSLIPPASPARKRAASDIEENRFLSSPESVATDTPRPKRPAKNHYGEMLNNDKIPRKTHRKRCMDPNIEPEEYYGPPPPKPRSWGPQDSRGRYLFTYTEKGELSPGKFFTKQEMRMYLLGPSPGENWQGPTRMPGVRAIKGKYRQGLTLWVGWPAAMANDRYPRGGESTKCRFKDCLYKRTISMGQPWVIFDERQNKDGEAFDPFQNAGYCHLYCLESNFDIVTLWNRVDIRPDLRAFKREQYDYFNLTNKLPGIERLYKKWWKDSMDELREIQRLNPSGRRKRTRETSLDACLVEYKLLREPKGQLRNRQKRGGVDMSKHRGDPELKRKLQALKKYDLLDEHGNPIEGADEQYEALHARKRPRVERSEESPVAVSEPRRRMSAAVRHRRPAPSYLAPPPPPPTHTPTPTQYSYPYQPSGMVSPLQAQYVEQPMPYAGPMTPAEPMPPMQYVPPAQPVLPVYPTQVAGRKRSRDETLVEEPAVSRRHTNMVNYTTTPMPVVVDQEGPAPKRQRVEEMTSEAQLPVDPTLDATFGGTANTALDAALEADVDEAIDAFFNFSPNKANGKSLDDTNNPKTDKEQSMPPQDEDSQGELDSLFGGESDNEE